MLTEQQLEQRRIEQMAALDQLPPTIRAAVYAAPYGVSTPHLLAMLRAGKTEEEMLAFIAWSEGASRELAIFHFGVIPGTTQPELRACRDQAAALRCAASSASSLALSR